MPDPTRAICCATTKHDSGTTNGCNQYAATPKPERMNGVCAYHRKLSERHIQPSASVREVSVDGKVIYARKRSKEDAL